MSDISQEQPLSPLVDLEHAGEELRQKPARRGGRHTSVYSDERLGMVLFLLEQGDVMPDHGGPALITIHVLQGHLEIAVNGEQYDLRSGGVLVVQPGLRHTVLAHQRTTMLLTVHRDAWS